MWEPGKWLGTAAPPPACSRAAVRSAVTEGRDHSRPSVRPSLPSVALRRGPPCTDATGSRSQAVGTRPPQGTVSFFTLWSHNCLADAPREIQEQTCNQPRKNCLFPLKTKKRERKLLFLSQPPPSARARDPLPGGPAGRTALHRLLARATRGPSSTACSKGPMSLQVPEHQQPAREELRPLPSGGVLPHLHARPGAARDGQRRETEAVSDGRPAPHGPRK